MTWTYKNDTDHIIIYRNTIWQVGEEQETHYPVPTSLGLTCTKEGSMPDAVLFHDDVIISAGEEKEILLNDPLISHNVDISIINMSADGGVECRFNHKDNMPIPIDIRGLRHVMSWELCSKIYLKNVTQNETHISVTAIEVVS